MPVADLTMMEARRELAWLRAINAIHTAAGDAELRARLTGAVMALTAARQLEIEDEHAVRAAEPSMRPRQGQDIVVPLVDPQGRRHGRLIARSAPGAGFDRDAAAVLGELALAAACTLSRLHPQAATRGEPPLDTLNDLAQRLAQVGGWSVDVARRRAYWTDQKAAIHGLPEGTWLDLDDAVGMFAPEYREMVAESYRRCATAGTPYDLEAELLTPQGERRWVRTIGIAERDAGGQIVRVNGAFQDISRIREAEDRFRFVAKATTDTVWDWNLVTNRFWWGEGGETLFGESSGDGWSDTDAWTQRIHPEDRVRVLESLQYVLNARRDSWRAEYRIRRPDGSYAQIADRGYVFFGADGKPVRMVGGMSDVTETRQLEARVNQAQRLEAIGQLTGGVAHDFNNLLTVILGNAEALIEGAPGEGERRRRLAEMVREAAERGADLTRRLLAVARRQALQPAAIDLGALVQGMEGLLRQAAGDSIVLGVEVAADCWDAMADAPQLEAAILNLVLNARDAMPEGGLLSITARNVELGVEDGIAEDGLAPGGYVMVEVRDDGTGMTEEVAAKAFEPFFTTKDMARGSGLGLSTVYGFARQSGGTARLCSVAGKGTAVRLYLPPADVRAGEEGRGTGEPLQGGTEKILLVEDDEMVRDHVSAQLVRLGYRVIAAADGPEGLRMLQAEPDLDLLFTDIRMPGGMDGTQLAEQARRLRPGLKVLFTSGYVDDAVLQDEIGMLSKPYRRSELARALRDALDGGGHDL
ncbi:PAS domain-containing protein [Marinibaculum pumilum]|uniref:histidine kinase n=1 Tax=Marinibaculum pumilum TaxID=1766165 RepID=A0ABV7KU72_9PROT